MCVRAEKASRTISTTAPRRQIQSKNAGRGAIDEMLFFPATPGASVGLGTTYATSIGCEVALILPASDKPRGFLSASVVRMPGWNWPCSRRRQEMYDFDAAAGETYVVHGVQMYLRSAAASCGCVGRGRWMGEMRRGTRLRGCSCAVCGGGSGCSRRRLARATA